MKIESGAFEYGERIPSRYTCDGEDVVPPLTISSVPKNAKSLALLVDDPDSPTGTWLHWSVWNIPPETTCIDEKTLPKEVVEGMTTFGKTGWGGPCPGSGEHRYFFRLFALDIVLPLLAGALREELEAAMKGHILEDAEWMGRYQRK